MLLCEAKTGVLTNATIGYEFKAGDEFISGEYVCGKVKSSYKGFDCQNDTDCELDQSWLTGKCKCSPSSEVKKCGLMNGDDEWVDYFDKVYEYYTEEERCHY